MILTPERRKDFLIHLLTERSELGSVLEKFLAAQGFQVQWLKTFSGEACPHLVIIDLAGTSAFADILKKYNEQSAEIIFIAIAPLGLAAKLEEYRPFGIYLTIPFLEGFDWAIYQALDLICSELLLRYQNEQMLENFEKQQLGLQQQLQFWKEKAETAAKQAQELTVTIESQKQQWQQEKNQLQLEIASLKKIQADTAFIAEEFEKPWALGEEDPLVWLFKVLEKECKVKNGYIYFLRFVPETSSFYVVQSLSWHGDDSGKSLSAFRPKFQDSLWSLLKNEFANLEEQLKNHLIAQKHQVDHLLVYPLLYPHGIEGIIIFSGMGDGVDQALRKFKVLVHRFEYVWGYYRLYGLYQKGSQHIDEITSFEKRDRYFEKLTEEIRRAQRLSLPVSLIKIALDNYKEIMDAYGFAVIRSILRQMASLLRTSGRVHDLFFRTEENEISVILPHTAVDSAVIVAERFRRLIDKAEFIDYPPRYVSISAGVSGFPDLAAEENELERTALAALQFVQQKGLNRVCLYSPPTQKDRTL